LGSKEVKIKGGVNMNNFVLGQLIYSWIIVILWRVCGKQLDKINEKKLREDANCKTVSIDYKSKLFKVVGMIVLQSVYLGFFIRDFMNNRYTNTASAITFIVVVTVIPVSLINAIVIGMRKKEIIIATVIASILTFGWYIIASMIWI
jgi:hypothetical protein